MATKGIFGEEAKQLAIEYAELSGMEVFIKVVSDFYQPRKTEEDGMMFTIAELFCRLIIVIYREAKQQDSIVAEAFLNSFLKDFPNSQGSCVYPQWESLARAAYAFKVVKSHELLAWQQSIKLVQAYNEFLNVLLGYFIVAWRCALGKKYSTHIFDSPYGLKLNEFSQLTGGENGAFYLLFRLAKPNLRNAIAHEEIWVDKDANKVKFSDGKGTHTTYEIDLAEFLGFAAVGSHLGQAYIAAIAAILILETGNIHELEVLPTSLVSVFRHRKKSYSKRRAS